MNLIFVEIYEFNFSKKNVWLAHFLVITYTTSEFNFMKNTKTLLAQFRAIIYITSECSFYEKKTNTLLAQFWVIICITSEWC